MEPHETLGTAPAHAVLDLHGRWTGLTTIGYYDAVTQQQRVGPAISTGGLLLLLNEDGYPTSAVFADTSETVSLDHPDLASLNEAVRSTWAAMQPLLQEWHNRGRDKPTPPELSPLGVAHHAAYTALADAVMALHRPGRAVHPRRRRQLPTSLRQPTFPEAKATSRALSDAPTLRRWEPLALGEIAWRWAIPGDPLEVKFDADRLAKWWDVPKDVTDLEGWLRQLGFHAMVLFNVSLALVRSQHGVCDVTLDDLIERIGWAPHSRCERDEMRRKVWLWLNAFAATSVIGARRGKYRDRHTGKVHDMATADPLLTMSVPVVDGIQLSFDPGVPPPAVTLYAAGILARFRDDRRVLTDYGDVLALGSIPNGKPTGAWAQGIGFALHQRWREMADWPPDRPDRYRFTRRELLDLHRPPPPYDEVLAGNDPGRARRYWDGAIRVLRDERHLIGRYVEPVAPTGGKSIRQGWAASWLDEALTIEPATPLTADAERIAWSGTRRRHQTPPRRQQDGPRRSPSPE
jgi:hypothetical protein